MAARLPEIGGEGSDPRFDLSRYRILRARKQLSDGNLEHRLACEGDLKGRQSTTLLVASELVPVFPANEKGELALRETGTFSICLEIICETMRGHERGKMSLEILPPD